MIAHTDSELSFKGPCNQCGSSDGNAHYTDGHTYCFVCSAYGKDHDQVGVTASRPVNKEPRFLNGEFRDLSKRCITEATCRKFDYRVGKNHEGKTVQISFLFAPGTRELVAQKVRPQDKDGITTIGSIKDAGLFGQEAWRDKGKMIVVTEGEIDAMSVSQVQDNRWPVVSVPNGASGAKKALSRSMEWLLGFDTIILMFDDDQAGRDAVAECAPLFPTGRVKVARVEGHKDANEALMAGDGTKIIDAIWGAKSFRPDGIVRVADIRDRTLAAATMGLPWCLQALTDITFGRNPGDVILLGAGTGVGKTDFLTQQIAYDINTLELRVACFMLEQDVSDTLKRIAGKQVGKVFHVPDESWTQEELTAAIDTIGADDRLALYDNFGSMDWHTIKSVIRYLAHSDDVKVVYLDHLTALAAAEEDERKALEQIMAEAAMLAKELGIVLIMVSHLTTPDGKPHEEGGRVMIRHFKGSRAIGFWSHFMIGLERDQQSEAEELRSTTTLRVLKDRKTGRATGKTLFLGYEQSTGRLFHKETPDDAARHGFRDETEDAF